MHIEVLLVLSVGSCEQFNCCAASFVIIACIFDKLANNLFSNDIQSRSVRFGPLLNSRLYVPSWYSVSCWSIRSSFESFKSERWITVIGRLQVSLWIIQRRHMKMQLRQVQSFWHLVPVSRGRNEALRQSWHRSRTIWLSYALERHNSQKGYRPIR